MSGELVSVNVAVVERIFVVDLVGLGAKVLVNLELKYEGHEIAAKNTRKLKEYHSGQRGIKH